MHNYGSNAEKKIHQQALKQLEEDLHLDRTMKTMRRMSRKGSMYFTFY
jgi:hypothetical protein